MLHGFSNMRMTRFTHNGPTGVFANHLRQSLATLDVKDDFSAGRTREDIFGENHHQPIGPDYFTFARDNHDAITVTVKG